MPGIDTWLAGLSLGGQGVQTILDPSLNDALSPASGLVVSPYYFQSIETEGRWKHQLWGFSEGRNLVPPEWGMPKDKDAGNPKIKYRANPAPKVFAGASRLVDVSLNPLIVKRRASLLTVDIGALKDSPKVVQNAIKAAGYALGGPILNIVVEHILAAGRFTIGATWLASETEILVG